MHCTKCKSEQPENLFSKDKSRISGYHPWCKNCCKLARDRNRDLYLQKKKLYNKRPEVRKARQEYARKYYGKNKIEMKSQMADFYSQVENRKKKLLWKSRERSKEEGLEHTITIDDIIIPEVCPYLEIPLTHSLGKGQLPSNSSIDRIDSTKGYIPGNVQIISRLANTMKNNATNDQLITFAKNVLKIEGTNIQRYIEVITNEAH